MLIVTAEHGVTQADVSATQHALSASVVVANDIPMLHVMEAYQDATCHEMSTLRHFRLDTVEDDQSMPASLQLPHSPGKDRFPFETLRCNYFEVQLRLRAWTILGLRASANLLELPCTLS